MTFEQFTGEAGLELVEVHSTRTTITTKGSLKEDVEDHQPWHEFLILLQVPRMRWPIKCHLRDGGKEYMRFLRGVSRVSRDDARKQFAQRIRGGTLVYINGGDPLAKPVEISVPLDLE